MTNNKKSSIRYIDDNTALVTKAFQKNASIFGTDEFKLWREYKAMFPDAKMTTKTIKKNPNKLNITKNMTYEKSTNMLRRVAEHYAAIKGQETRKYRILAEASPEKLEAYLDDEVFQQAVINSYEHIDLSGDNEKNISRVFAKMDRTAEWLRKKTAILAQEF